MNNNQTQITYEKVRQDANTIKTCANKMNSIFTDFNATMRDVGADDVFSGTASESLSSSHASLKSRFEDYIRTVEKFSNMILYASSSTEATEKSIARDAENLPH